MIARLTGRLAERSPTRVVVDVHGVGYELAVPLSTSGQLGVPGTEVTLHTRLVVRESSMELFGFHSLAEREVFDLLLQVTGIGPKLALAVLSGAEVHLLRRAIGSGDVDLLTTVPGIGRKTAQRILVELREKIGEAWEHAPAAGPGAESDDAVEALVSLGYPRAGAVQFVRQAAQGEPGASAEDLLRRALALARGAARAPQVPPAPRR
ncbi:MAG TPA: Holliday junction branch migration protein RuvA [Candidatus Saccharimonadales bacterium]|nr:Holliday junction branch migration protein RuvA [Candidatus Saccharimonadales bacterium]